MIKQSKITLDNVINDLSFFLEKEYSSRFKKLSDKEDRHLFSLAKILVQLKHIHEEILEDKIITFPVKSIVTIDT